MNFYIYENLYLNDFNHDIIDYYRILYKKPLIKIYLKNKNYNKKIIKRDINNKTIVYINKNFNYINYYYLHKILFFLFYEYVLQYNLHI